MLKSAISISSLALILSLAGCATAPGDNLAAPPTAAGAAARPNQPAVLPPPPPFYAEATPIDMGQNGSKPVSFERAIVTMEAGTPIGKVTGGWLHVTFRSLRANPGDADKACVQVGREELRKAHYSTPDASNALFGEHQMEKIRYQLGADITFLQMDLHVQPGWIKATLTSKGTISVTWQVFDTRADKVVFTLKTTTSYQDQSTSDGGVNPELGMFRKAFRELLAQKEFAAFMSPDSPEPVGNVGKLPVIKVAPGTAVPSLALPDGFGQVLDSFITLEPGQVLGSAFLISPDGYALTAAHVVSGLKTVPARLHSGIVLDAEVVRINDESDVALIKLPGSSFKALAPAAPGEPPIGSDVFVVGNPRMKELNASVSKGVVSGNRLISGHKYLQTDAAANPGSSGGPVLDRKGTILGVISWKFAGAELQGLAFAVPLGDALSSLNVELNPAQ